MYMRERFYDVLPPMPDAVSFDVTQAAQWYIRDDEKANYDLSEFHCLVPPYPATWMEFFAPKQARINGKLEAYKFVDLQGVLFLTTELGDEAAKSIQRNNQQYLPKVLENLLGRSIPPVPGQKVVEEKDTLPRWLVASLHFGGNRGRALPLSAQAMTLDVQGKWIAHCLVPMAVNLTSLYLNISQEQARQYVGGFSSEQLSMVHKAIGDSSTEFLFCLALLHCRNVETKDVPPQPAPILKQRAKKGIPYIQYKTLEVTPLRTVRQGGTRKDGTPEPKALHFVRGHFKDFSDKGLFGKYKGVYWWDSQVRGDTAKGIIDKDYKVSRD